MVQPDSLTYGTGFDEVRKRGASRLARGSGYRPVLLTLYSLLHLLLSFQIDYELISFASDNALHFVPLLNPISLFWLVVKSLQTCACRTREIIIIHESLTAPKSKYVMVRTNR